MKEKKIEEMVCPECGGYSVDSDFRWIEDGTASTICHCGSCGATWYEYFSLVYDGYAYKDVAYDEIGEEM